MPSLDERSPSMLNRLVAAAALSLALAGCSNPTLPTDEWVRARAAGDATLAVTNRGDEPVYVLIADPTVLAVMMACTPDTCTRIGPGQAVRVPYAEIENYTPDDVQASVSWWVFENGTRTVAQGNVVVEL
jgi:hypothetical protein